MIRSNAVRNLRSVVAGLLATLLSLALPALASAEALRVALSPDYMPLAFMQDGKLLGVEVDNAREVASILGREVEFVPMPQDEYIAALNDRRVDVVMSGYSVTPEREAQVSFSRPFMEVGQMAIVLAERAGQFAYPRALYRPDIRMGAEPGTTGERYIKENFPSAVYKAYRSPDEAFAALRERDLDVFIHDAPTSWNLASSRENQDLLSLYRPLTREKLAWAVRKDNTRLLNDLNRALAELENNGRLSAIQNYWIPVTVQVR
ncbi:MAG: transporter substrate-binding domain-containing protein [Halieaceae bacterium]|jgi:polar amino acid transport system substrate-binding protein|nr:transporter substrate-binding domain-containing protein [Halieaceae bacterium]